MAFAFAAGAGTQYAALGRSLEYAHDRRRLRGVRRPMAPAVVADTLPRTPIGITYSIESREDQRNLTSSHVLQPEGRETVGLD